MSRRPRSQLRSTLLLLAFIVIPLFEPPLARTEWQGNGVAITAAAGHQERPAIASDGAGGAIIAWRDGLEAVYARRVDLSGVPMWAAGGVRLSSLAGTAYDPAMAPDGAGGAIVVWPFIGSGTTDIHAQRVDATGALLWADTGILVTADHPAEAEAGPVVVSDGAGGAIVAWTRSGSGGRNVFAQRLAPAGAPLWPAEGIPICTAANDQLDLAITPDGAGGAIVTWRDNRDDPSSDVYAQRIDGSGVALWTDDGVLLTTAPDAQIAPGIVTDGNGGAIIGWQDHRTGGQPDVYAQRVTSGGAPQWTEYGSYLSTAINEQQFPVGTSDGAGGAVFAWLDTRYGVGDDVYIQRVDASGNFQWTSGGSRVSGAADNQTEVAIVSDGAAGAIVVWEDHRAGGWASADIYAQWMDAAGVAQWDTHGIPVSVATGHQGDPVAVSDGSGGAILAWQDDRNGTIDIYAGRVDTPIVGVDGTRMPGALTLLPNHPNPFRGETSFAIGLPAGSDVEIALYSVTGARVWETSLAGQTAGWRTVSLDGRSRDGSPLPSGVYLLDVRAGRARASGKVVIAR